MYIDISSRDLQNICVFSKSSLRNFGVSSSFLHFTCVILNSTYLCRKINHLNIVKSIKYTVNTMNVLSERFLRSIVLRCVLRCVFPTEKNAQSVAISDEVEIFPLGINFAIFKFSHN